MGYMYNHGLVTTAKGASWEQFRLKCTDGSGTLVMDEDCGSGMVASMTRNSAGNYTIQLNKPYPPKVIQVDANIPAATATTAVTLARYVRGSYSATTGQWTLSVTNAAGTGAQDPANGDEIHVSINFRRYTANP